MSAKQLLVCVLTFQTSPETGSRYSCTVAADCDGRQIYVVVSDQYGNSVTSNTVTISISPPEPTTTERPAAEPTTTVTTTVKTDTDPTTAPQKPELPPKTDADVIIKNDVSRIVAGDGTADALLDKFSGISGAVLKDKDGNVLAEKSPVGTGATLTLPDGMV